jgi:peroxiredoxin
MKDFGKIALNEKADILDNQRMKKLHVHEKALNIVIYSFIVFLCGAQNNNLGVAQKNDSILQLKVGTVFPDFTTVNLKGDTLRGIQLKGKITFINFWFKSCAPCIAEMKHLNEMYQKFKDNPDFRFLSFTSDPKEIAEEAVRQFQIPFEVCPVTKKEYESMYCKGFPTNIIVDASGKIAHIETGGPMSEAKAGINVNKMELLTAYLLMKINYLSKNSYAVSPVILPDSLIRNRSFAEMQEYLINTGYWTNDSTSRLKGKIYPDFKATTISGKELSQQQLAGKVTLINIWDSRCVPCMAEMEYINKLYIQLKKNHLSFQLLSFTDDDIETAKEIIRKYDVQYEVSCISNKECKHLAYNSGFPTRIVIDPSGKVTFYEHGGYTDEEKVAKHFEELKEEIEKLFK